MQRLKRLQVITQGLEIKEKITDLMLAMCLVLLIFLSACKVDVGGLKLGQINTGPGNTGDQTTPRTYPPNSLIVDQNGQGQGGLEGSSSSFKVKNLSISDGNEGVLSSPSFQISGGTYDGL